MIRRLLIDVSFDLVRNHKTGIERVMNKILENTKTIETPFKIEPVVIMKEGIFIVEMEQDNMNVKEIKEAANLTQGDVFCFTGTLYPFKVSELNHIKNELGVKFISIVHDLIPISHSKYCYTTTEPFTRWIMVVARACDGVICNSVFTKDVFLDITEFNGNTSVISLGCDFFNGTDEVHVNIPKHGKNILMVSTIDPRKRYDMALMAFEKIWKTNTDTNLIIVGKRGFNVDHIIDVLENHPLKNKNLFWFGNLSDAELRFLYKNCDAFLFTSDVEGFGLGVTEAASHNLPLILRDIRVFREIAEDKASYFNTPDELATIILEGDFKKPTGMKINTWNDTTHQFIDSIAKMIL